MAVHLEFVVLGPPISNQQSSPSGRQNLVSWRADVEAAARRVWASPILTGALKGIIINLHIGNKPSLDVDNMSKPIFDVLESVVYNDDRQIRQAQITHLEIGSPFSIVGVSPIIVNAIQSGQQFVYVRIEDPVDPYPLPR
jgi:Holliday junction resolvase RusA-like endonuclease